MKKFLHICIIVLSVLLTIAMILFVILLVHSPGKPRPFTDKEGNLVPGSIAIVEAVNVNGLNQRMIIRGLDTTKPVLLYLHGGPGSPEFPFVRQFDSDIEKLFVVCYWDQRGAGLSYSDKVPPETMTLQQFIDDAGKVTEYLLHRFNRNKIYLLGHSWGTMLGAFTAQKYPQYYYAFIAVGQVGQQVRSEIISFNFCLERSKKLNDKKAVKILEKMGPPPYPDPKIGLANMLKERKLVTRYGGAIKHGDFYPQAMKALFFCSEYNLRDKISYLKGMNYTLNYLWNTVITSNLFRDVPVQQIPVYMMQGTFDYQTAFPVAKEYFDSLKAPLKKFYPFENSAHSPIFEEPDKFEEILMEILSEGSVK
jgi:pimeloyl-ACP methyl ester carboxylesterase